MAEAGDKTSDEAREALASAEKLVDSSKKKLGELKDASDEQFDKIVDSAKDTWADLSAQVEGGWDAVSNKIKSLFA